MVLQARNLDGRISRGTPFGTIQLVLLVALHVSCLVLSVSASQCHAKCSPHFTLPCSFGAFDKCIERSCQDLCRNDGNRKVAACYCRGTVEGPTMRACFCSPSPNRKTLNIF
uniref:Uncharacterized protein n=1 Tax=Panagrellus redivivus TaxID=6233 RepID=A0A7E4V2F3_PANRE